jgi:DNA-binding beta-propeller fold protein YncE
MRKRRKSSCMTLVAILLMIMSLSCHQRVETEPAPIPLLVWPKPPEVPRIRFLKAVTWPEDMDIRAGLFRRLFDYIAGKQETGMISPYGVETDTSGRLYVVDTFLKKVHLFDPAAGKYLTIPGEESDLLSPIDLAVDRGTGDVFVSDSQGGTVRRYGKGKPDALGKELFKRPTGLAVNEKSGELLVVDTLNDAVFRFALEDMQLTGRFGSSGTGHGTFNRPTNIFVDRAGRIYVTDSLNFRIQVFSPEGTFRAAFGTIGDNPGRFARPRGVAVDSDGNIYVVDGLFDNVQIFDREFRLLMAFGGPGSDFGEFWLPTGIFIDGDDTIYVSDQYNKRVQVFKYLKEGEELP